MSSRIHLQLSLQLIATVKSVRDGSIFVVKIILKAQTKTFEGIVLEIWELVKKGSISMET